MLPSIGTNWASSCSASSPKLTSKPQQTHSLSLLCPSHCSAHFHSLKPSQNPTHSPAQLKITSLQLLLFQMSHSLLLALTSFFFLCFSSLQKTLLLRSLSLLQLTHGLSSAYHGFLSRILTSHPVLCKKNNASAPLCFSHPPAQISYCQAHSQRPLNPIPPVTCGLLQEKYPMPPVVTCCLL